MGAGRFAHAWMRKLHGRWFELSDTGFDDIDYAGMPVYKLGILCMKRACAKVGCKIQ